MNWNAIAFDWNHIKAFLATAQQGSFSGAARLLGQSQPTVGRQIAGLEDRLGVMLFDRLGRNLQLTPSGHVLLAHVQDMADAAQAISLTATSQSQTIEGKVSITASDVLSVYVLPRIIADIARQAPALEIEIIASDDVKDLLRRDADIAIRHLRPSQPELVARLVAEPLADLYAHHTYLRKHGPLPLGKAAHGHAFLSMGDTARMSAYLTGLGLDMGPHQFPYGSQNGLVTWQLAQQGLGICAMSCFVADACPDMLKACPDLKPFSFPLWLVSHRELQTSRRIRLVYDTLCKALAQPRVDYR